MSQPELDVTSLFDRVTRMLVDQSGHVDPTKAVHLAAELIPHAQHSGITLIGPNGRPRTIAATDTLPEAVDALQYRLHEGPCLDAAQGDPVVRADDLATDRRWLRFSDACLRETAVRSMLSLRLAVRGTHHAAINLYATSPEAFDDVDVRVASILATFAALSVQRQLHGADTANLQAALQSNRQIGMAIGILMATEKVTEQEAFQLLRRTSNQLNRKLVDIAERVQLTGHLPEPPPAGRR